MFFSIRIIPALRPSGHAAHPAGYKPLRPGCHGFVPWFLRTSPWKSHQKYHGKYCVYHCIYMCWHVFTLEKKEASCSILANLGRMALVFSCHGFNGVVSDTIDGSICCKNFSTPVLWKMTWFTTFFQQQVRKRTSLDNSSMTPKFAQRVGTGFQLSHGWRSNLLEHHTDLIRSCNVMYSVPCHPCLGDHRTWWITHTENPLW